MKQIPMPLEPPLPPPPLKFDSETYSEGLDKERLGRQLAAVKALMGDGAWRSLREISAAVGCPEASASARLRDLRKHRCGGHLVERRRRGDPAAGVHEYRLRGGGDE